MSRLSLQDRLGLDTCRSLQPAAPFVDKVGNGDNRPRVAAHEKLKTNRPANGGSDERLDVYLPGLSATGWTSESGQTRLYSPKHIRNQAAGDVENCLYCFPSVADAVT